MRLGARGWVSVSVRHVARQLGCLPPTVQMYVGNYEYDASERELERLFERYGRLDRVDYKSGALLLLRGQGRCRRPSLRQRPPTACLPGHSP